MPCSHGGLSLSVPPSSLAWGSSDQSPQYQRVHIGGLVEGHSGGLLSGGDVHSVWPHNLANIVISRSIVGGVLCMFNHDRHYWTPPKWLGSSAVFPSDGSPPMVWLLLWTSGGGAAMRNEPWVWLEVGNAGTSSTEQCLWGWHRWWDSNKKQIDKNNSYVTCTQTWEVPVSYQWCHTYMRERARENSVSNSIWESPLLKLL